MFFWMSNNFFLPILPIHYHTLGMSDHQIGIAIDAFSIGAVLLYMVLYHFCFYGKLAKEFGESKY
jgi:hypothetical protein